MRSKRALLLVAFGLAGCLATVQIVWALAVLVQPGEMQYGESLIHDQAARLLRGEALYQDYSVPPYTVAAYTPVYYVIVAALRAVVGVGFTAGRLVSLSSAILLGWLVYGLTVRATCQRSAGVLAALMFVAAGLAGGAAPPGSLLNQFASASVEPPSPAWAALYKEDLLGIALALSAIALLARSHGAAFCLSAGLLAGLAILTKQTLIAATFAGCIWLWLLERRAALLYASASIGLVAVVSVASQALTGAFIANAVVANANPTSFEALSTNLKIFPLFQAGLLAASAVTVVACLAYIRAPHKVPAVAVSPGVSRDLSPIVDTGRVRLPPAISLVTLYWAATLLPLVGFVKAGANVNYWIELAAPTAVLATIAMYRAPTVLPLALVTANLAILTVLLTPPLLRTSVAYFQSAQQQTDFDALVSEVRAEPRDVLAAPQDVITLAQKRILFEPYIFSIWFSTGQWDPTPMVQRICDGQIGLLVLDRPVEQPPFEFDGYSSWPSPVLDALRQTAVLQKTEADRYVYRLSRPCQAGLRTNAAG